MIGATGTIGQRILNEALTRGHQVTAIVRDKSRLSTKHSSLAVNLGDALDAESVASAAAGQDVFVSAYGPGKGDPQLLVKAAHAAIAGVGAASKKNGREIRLIVVGGAGSLEVAPGVRLIDTPQFPAAWKPAAGAACDALALYRQAPVNWTFFSPAALIQPGTRTGKYRVGTDNLVTDAKGESRISAEDFAVALVDEIEKPRFERKRFTVAY